MLQFSPNRCILTRRVSTQTGNASKGGKLQHTNQTWHQNTSTQGAGGAGVGQGWWGRLIPAKQGLKVKTGRGSAVARRLKPAYLFACLRAKKEGKKHTESRRFPPHPHSPPHSVCCPHTVSVVGPIER